MRKTIRILTITAILFLLIPAVFAFNPFYKFLGLFVKFSPDIEAANVYPVKIRPGDVLLINVTAKDVYGISKVTAKVEHESGFDLVELSLKEKNNYQGTWICHNSKNMKWYDVDVEVTNLQGVSSFTKTKYQDPTKSHPAAEVTAGTFDAGDFTFQGNVSVSSLIGWDGWIPAEETWTYDSSDDPTYTFNIAGNKTNKYSAGMRLKLTDSGTQYFIVTKVNFSNPNTTITMYGGTDYDLSTGTITNPFYSTMKAPYGFPLDPDKWTVEVTDTTKRTQTTPTQNTWYNLGSISITIPIGCFNVEYNAPASGYDPALGGPAQVTLSTASNSESDANFTTYNSGNIFIPMIKNKVLNLTVKTTYYLNVRTIGADVDYIESRNDYQKLFIRARSVYI